MWVPVIWGHVARSLSDKMKRKSIARVNMSGFVAKGGDDESPNFEKEKKNNSYLLKSRFYVKVRGLRHLSSHPGP
ncbi:hypothetical protein HanRHA438_Chr09g0398781 [Helianthus annuus]|nr:hypothetical protein HanRHA438_Chr09g0398781 [Helianthus annuus]